MARKSGAAEPRATDQATPAQGFRAPLAPEKRTKIEEMLRAGKTTGTAIAKIVGVGRRTVTRIAKELNIHQESGGEKEKEKSIGAAVDKSAGKEVLGQHIEATTKRARAFEARVHEVGEILISTYEGKAAECELGIVEFIQQKVEFCLEHGENVEEFRKENDELRLANNALAAAVMTACNRTSTVIRLYLAAKQRGVDLTEVEMNAVFQQAKDLFSYPKDPTPATAPMNRPPSSTADAPRRNSPVGAGEASAGVGEG